MKSQRKLLIYSHDGAMRKAYASYLDNHGISADSCGTVAQLKKLLTWYKYEFILINIDNLAVDRSREALEALLAKLRDLAQHQTLLIATSAFAEETHQTDKFDWFLQEPLTPKAILTKISQIRQQFPKKHIRLRKSLSKPIEFDQ